MRLAAIFLIVFMFLSSSAPLLAQGIGLTRPTTDDRGFIIKNNSSANLGTLIPNVIGLFFTVGGLGFVIMMLWGAVDWILSGGDKEKIAGARKRITTAIIGLTLLSLTFVIMLVAGQILGINALKTGIFGFKGLLSP